MERILEPELMDDGGQAKAYADADFEEPHSRIIELFNTVFPDADIKGEILDLGCGPGDITFRYARRFPAARVTGIDGSAAMLHLANQRKKDEEDIADRINFVYGYIPGADIPDVPYELVVSNSLLHHLHQPDIMWDTVNAYAASGTIVYVVDLFRPDSKETAWQIVNKHSGDESDILKKDFYHSLLAAFRPDEITLQLDKANLSELSIKIVSDRHLIIYGVKK